MGGAARRAWRAIQGDGASPRACVCGHCETLTAGFRVSGTEAARSGVVVQDEAASMA